MQDLAERTQSLGLAHAPAKDDASTSQIRAVYEHAQVCASMHEQMYQYAKQYADSLGKAVEEVEAADFTAGEAARNAGRGM